MNAEPERVELDIPQPAAAEVYYTTCSQIDQHNRCRQDDLNIEKKLGTHDWAKRVNMSLFSMCVVDAWKVYEGCATSMNLNQAQFYELLAEELIDNNEDGVRVQTRTRQVPTGRSPTGDVGPARAGVGVHLTPTKRKRKKKDGGVTSYNLQGSCRICRHKTTHECSRCRDLDPNETGEWYCHSATSRDCFDIHLSTLNVHETALYLTIKTRISQ